MNTQINRKYETWITCFAPPLSTPTTTIPQTYKVVNDPKLNIAGGVTTGHGDTKTGSQELADKVHAGLGNTEVSGDEAGQGDGGVEESATDSSECPSGHHQSDSERECDTQHSSISCVWKMEKKEGKGNGEQKIK